LFLGLKSWRFGFVCPLSEAIRRTAIMNFQFIEISNGFLEYNNRVYVWPREVALEYRSQIKKLLEKHNLQSGVLLPTPGPIKMDQNQFKLIESNLSETDVNAEDLRSLKGCFNQALNLANDVGSSIIDGLQNSTLKEDKELFDFSKLAEECRVKVGVENKNETSAKQIKDALKSAEAQNVGVTFDVGHAYQFLKNSQRVAEFITDLGEMIIHTHIHDEDKEHNIFHAPIGMGDIDYIKIVRAFKEIDYQGCLMLEISPSDTPARPNTRYQIPSHPDMEILQSKWILEYLIKLA